jgi:hypothetical protein
MRLVGQIVSRDQVGRVWYPALALLATALASCTPLGMWIYEDPRFNLVDVRASDSTPGLVLVLAGCNTNDYELSTEPMTTRLILAGHRAGETHGGNSIVLPSRKTSHIPVRLQAQVPAGSSGTRRLNFTLVNEVTVLSPIGPRKLEQMEHGTITLQDGALAGWEIKDQPGCKPGESVLPPAAGRYNGPPIPIPTPPPVPLGQPR